MELLDKTLWEQKGAIAVCRACGAVDEGTIAAGLAHEKKCDAYRFLLLGPLYEQRLVHAERLFGGFTSGGRPDWDHYYMGFAIAASVRATCDRKHVGAVIVAGGYVAATGYNGSVVGMPHCDDVGHDMVDGHCARTIHAEMNALAQAARRGVAISGGTIYTTASPCWDCFRVLVNANLQRFVYAEDYRGEEHRARIQAVVEATGVVVEKLG